MLIDNVHEQDVYLLSGVSSSSPMLEGLVRQTAPLLPIRAFNHLRQGYGLEEHP